MFAIFQSLGLGCMGLGIAAAPVIPGQTDLIPCSPIAGTLHDSGVDMIHVSKAIMTTTTRSDGFPSNCLLL